MNRDLHTDYDYNYTMYMSDFLLGFWQISN